MLFKKEPTENFSETHFLDLLNFRSFFLLKTFFFIQMKTIRDCIFCCSLHFFIFFTQLFYFSLKHSYIEFTTLFSVFDNKVGLILIKCKLNNFAHVTFLFNEILNILFLRFFSFFFNFSTPFFVLRILLLKIILLK